MASQIPSHHIKQNVCATRSPYREGRQPKAVKVYTVNNESSYILIQGVPSVGAMQELHKLCSTFGLVEKFNALDDYPTEDKYSEVYLVRYKKIQSARFAKRKLDDHSFFGGILHVCYAPEYESVIETREKLQDRRRVVAAKIRQHAENTRRLQQPSTGEPLQVSLQPLDTRHHWPVAQEPKESIGKQQSGLEVSATLSIPEKLDNVSATCTEISNPSNIGYETSPVQPTFEIPLPPKSSLTSHPDKNITRTTYEFSRVRSAHATLPAGYDARVIIPSLIQSPQPVYKHGIEVNRHVSNSLETTELSSSGSPSNSTVSSSGIVVKNYQPAKVPPRFVPRQAVKTTAEKQKHDLLTRKQRDQLDQEIRKNAFCLAETQGPALVPQRKRTFATAAQQSVNETIMEIRNKISKVITQNVKKQNEPAGPTL